MLAIVPDWLIVLERTEATTKPVGKTLRFDSANYPMLANKTERLALLPDRTIAVINNDDFGISGARTQIVVLRGLELEPR